MLIPKKQSAARLAEDAAITEFTLICYFVFIADAIQSMLQLINTLSQHIRNSCSKSASLYIIPAVCLKIFNKHKC